MLYERRRPAPAQLFSASVPAARTASAPVRGAAFGPSGPSSGAAASLFSGLYDGAVDDALQLGVRGGHERGDGRIDGKGASADRKRPEGSAPARPGQRFGGSPAADGGAPVSRSEDGTDFSSDPVSPLDALVDVMGRVNGSQSTRPEPGAVDPFSHVTTPTSMTGKNPSDRASQQSEGEGSKSKEVQFKPLGDSWDERGASGVLSNLWARVSYYAASDDKYQRPPGVYTDGNGVRGMPAPDAAGGDGGPAPKEIGELAPRRDAGAEATARKRWVAGPDVTAQRDIRPVDVQDVAELARLRSTKGRSTPAPEGGSTMGVPTSPKKLTPGGLGGGVPGTDPTGDPGRMPGGPTPDGPADGKATDGEPPR